MQNFSKDQFKEVLKKLGITKGDKLFVHSYSASLGKIEDIQDVIAAILETIDYQGVVAMPTYTYSTWPKTGYFDPKTTKAETGVLPNAFISFKDVYRTIQGNHSVAVWGDENNHIIRDWVPSSFSKDSTIYQTLRHNYKNVMIGTTFSTGCSIFHCIEEELKVPYRFRKSFPGVVELGQEKREFDFTMFVRDLDYNVDLRKAEPFLEKAPFIKSLPYNYGEITVFPLSAAYETIRKELENNPFLFVSETKKI